MLKLFKKAEEPKRYWLFPKDPPLPPCPFSCRRTKIRAWMDGREQELPVSLIGPCEHQLAVAEERRFDAHFEQVWDTAREEWHVVEKRR